MTTRTPPVLKVPAITLDKVARNVSVALFLRGTEAFAGARGQVKIEDDDGKQADARVITATVGRFFAMCSAYMAQSVYNVPSTGVGSTAPYLAGNPTGLVGGGGVQASDTALFDALDDGSPGVMHPLEPYTVVLVVVAAEPTQAPTATTAIPAA